MLDGTTLEKLGCWHGYQVDRVVWPEAEAGTIRTAPEAGEPGDALPALLRALPGDPRDGDASSAGPAAIRSPRLVVPHWRVWCEQCCGSQLERLDWLSRYQRVTDRLAEACSRLLRATNVQAVAQFYGLGWHTVKALDKARLSAELEAPDWTSIRYLAIDEFALHKGHRYATVVIDPLRRQVLWLGLGRSQESGIEALQRFCERPKPYLHGIVARCRHPLNTSVVQGINNTIEVIKRGVYGCRDQEYFFLRIRAAFPGIARRTFFPLITPQIALRAQACVYSMCRPNSESLSKCRPRLVLWGGASVAMPTLSR